MSEDSVVECIADPDVLERYTGIMRPLLNECKLHMSDAGWHVTAVDPSNVAMVDRLELAPRAFEHYDAPGSVTVGLNLERFEDYIGPANEPVQLTVDMETRKLQIRYGSTETAMALIDPASIRSEPDTKDLELANQVVLEGEQFDHAVEMMDLVGDHMTIIGDVDEREVVFSGAGDTDETTVSYGDEDVIDASVATDAESIFSNGFMECFAGPMPSDAEVRLWFDDEFPCKIGYEYLGGALEAQFMLAPRIQST